MLSSGFYIGEVINVNPLEYSVEVKLSGHGNSRTSQTVVATPLSFHGGYSSKTVGVSLPEIGSLVLVVTPGTSGNTEAYILGYAREPSAKVYSAAEADKLDIVSGAMSPMGYYRANSPSDVLPGDFIVESSGGSHLRVNSGSEVDLGSSSSYTKYISVLGKGSILTSTDDYLFKSSIADVSVTSDLIKIAANVSDSSLRNPILQKGSMSNDLSIELGGANALDIKYTGSKVPAVFTINKEGEIVIKGSKVTIDSSSKVKRADGFDEIPDDWKTEVKGDTVLITEQYTMQASGDVIVSTTGNLDLRSGGDTVEYVGGLYKKVVSGTSVIKNSPNALLSGFNDAMVFQCDSGSVAIEAGSSLIPSIAKSQIRLESKSGGDIVIQSAMTPGGFMTSGSVVLSSPTPLSTTGAGGAFNYGIALNSPLCMLGNLPGVELTGAGLPNMFMPPIPMSPVNHDLLVKFTPLITVFTALAAGLTAYPPTIPVATALNAALGATAISLPTKTIYGL